MARTPSPLPDSSSLSRRLFCMLLGLGGMPWPSQAAPRDIRVLTGPDPGAQRQILQSLRARFPALVLESELPGNTDARHANTPLVTLGPLALKRAIELDGHGPLVSAFTSSQAYRRLTASRERNVTGIFADAAPQAQMQLIAALFERKATVGVLLSDASAYLEKPLRLVTQQTGLELLLVRIDASRDPVRAINALSGAHVLLAVPDSTLYTPDTLRAILESTYRRGIPVIGFSAATVAAGTLASAYPDVDDVIADVGDLIDSLGNLGTDALPEPRFPRYWRVTINDNVARSLGISITDKVRALGVRPPGRSG